MTLPQRQTRLLALFALVLLSAIVCLGPLGAGARLATHNEDYNYLLLVPAISAALMFLERRPIFAESRYSGALGVPVIAAGFLGCLACRFMPQAPWLTSFGVFAFVVFMQGSFLFLYGPSVLRRAAFPMLFLFLLIPPPPGFLDWAIESLRSGSAVVSYWLFRSVHVPVMRQGFSLVLPGVEVEVARQCSGIRSSASLLLAGLVIGHLFLQSVSRKTILALCLLPLMIVKNAVRIAIISLLGVYVDPSYFTGAFHHQYAGMTVSALAVALLLPVIWALRRSEDTGR